MAFKSKVDPQKKIQSQILNTLAELGGKLVGEDDIEFGTKFQIPHQYEADLGAAIKYLTAYKEQQNEPTRFSRTFPYKPWDGAVAVMNAFQKHFGTRGVQISSFFDQPEMVSVPIDVDEQIQVPWGKLAVPAFRGVMRLGATRDDEGNVVFRIVVDTPKKNEGAVQGLWLLIEQELRENSIYRGKAFDGADMPKFLDLRAFEEDKVIYNDITLHQLDANIWTPIKRPEVLAKAGVSKKRAILLKGTFGTGKTLAAMWTAVQCQLAERTFIMCNPKDNNIFEVLQTAAMYQPACVFVEDIDKQTSSGDDQTVSEYLDMFDGLTSKGKDLIVVLTTNNPERIHKGMLRPGRLDAVIEIGHYDRKATERMIRSLFDAQMLHSELDFDTIYEALEGFTPAFIKETCEKVKLYSIARAGGEVKTPYETLDFQAAAEEMRAHYDLHTGANEGKKPDSFSVALKKQVQDVLENAKIVDIEDDYERFGVRVENKG